ncbi:60S ribosomal protein L18 [Musa troglodytarum]|uniref:Dynein light chain n=1 Tax=Musa troglodytarum TaxID=320322 RepID=A0A9E7FZU7_9LILI|nr:60S ribosomal protein L18 [Musa troglodytarum]
MGDESKSGAATAQPKELDAILKGVDMSDEMRSHACACARAAFQEHTVEKNIAEYIKKEFDAKYGHSWHCIVGRNFVKTELGQAQPRLS